MKQLHQHLMIPLITTLLLSACMADMPMGSATPTGMAGMDHSGMQMENSDRPFDLRFIDGMITHHQGAIDMATEAQTQATKQEIKDLADAIIAAQEREIAQMQTWRQTWYPDAAPTEGMEMDMGTMEVAPGDKLYDLRFIEAMIPHHESAVVMAKEAQTMAEHAEIKTLAADIIATQEAEIAQMQTWLTAWFGVETAAPSTYATQLDSPVRGLSTQEADDLRRGHGMGYARMAELNNHPGPRHLLDLQTALGLTANQAAQVTEIFTAMQGEATQLGAAIVAREAELSALFAAGDADETEVQAQVTELGDLYGQLRFVHLRAHLQVTPLLSPEQIVLYNQLRGYGDGIGQPHGAGMEQHGMHD